MTVPLKETEEETQRGRRRIDGPGLEARPTASQHGCKSNSMGKRGVSANGVGTLGYPHTKTKHLNLYLTPYTKINSK